MTSESTYLKDAVTGEDAAIIREDLRRMYEFARN